MLATAFLLASCSGTPPPLTPWPEDDAGITEPLPPEIQQAMFRVEGEGIVTAAGAPVQLRGIVFANEAWEHTAIPSTHHTAEDFARVRRMGMNSVGFYLSYKTFEDDDAPFVYKESGFDWIDQNVEWAKQNKIRLILNMHAPVGGAQSGGGGNALWESPELQERFVKLWRAIARKYRAEPTIVGFSILNEPAPTKNKEQWQELAQRTVNEIRRVDQHHIVFVERANAISGAFSEDEDRNFVRVNDDNVVYEFHFEKPFHFTHQNAVRSDFAAREAWYPDENAIEIHWYDLKTEAVLESPILPAGDSSWTMLETKPFVVRDERVVVGKPFLVCDQGEGSAVFDSLSLTRVWVPEDEKTTDLEGLEAVFEIDLDTRRGWYFWNPGGKGSSEFLPDGNGDSTAVSIRGTEGPANLGSDPLRFQPEQGYEYQLHGLAKGVGLSEKSRCGLRLEFYSSKVPIQKRDKAYLERELDAYLSWGEQEKVPLYLGEFGTIRDSFLSGRGGVKWVENMIELLQERALSYAYYAYHGAEFGLFAGERGLPSVDSANLPLFETFVKALVGPDADTQLAPLKSSREVSSGGSPKKKEKNSPPAPSLEEKETTPENYHDFE